METHMEKVSYIIGRQIGGDFTQQGIEVTPETFVQGFQDAIAGKEAPMSNEQMQEIMNAFQVEMAAKAQQQAQAQGAENKKLGDAFLAENKTKEEVKVTDSGLQYKVIQTGEGKTPEATQTVEVHYEGKLLDGTVFDSSYQRGQTTQFPVNQVIPGWTEALQLMQEGDIWELTIPADLAYGEQGAGGVIPPSSVLNFKVELVKVHA